MSRFDAVVQYGDWSGEAKADDADLGHDIRREFEKRKLVNSKEFVVAIKSYNAENQVGRKLAPVYVTALIVPASDYEEAQRYTEETRPLRVREVTIELTVEEWAGLFKRFSIALQWQRLRVVGREYLTEEEAEVRD